MNGTGNEAFDSLPEPIRAYLRTPDAGQDWSATAIAVRLRMTGDIPGTVEFLRVADENRRRAAYKELGHTVDPRTGEPL